MIKLGMSIDDTTTGGAEDVSDLPALETDAPTDNVAAETVSNMEEVD